MLYIGGGLPSRNRWLVVVSVGKSLGLGGVQSVEQRWSGAVVRQEKAEVGDIEYLKVMCDYHTECCNFLPWVAKTAKMH
jgi:hypothetical protein